MDKTKEALGHCGTYGDFWEICVKEQREWNRAERGTQITSGLLDAYY